MKIIESSQERVDQMQRLVQYLNEQPDGQQLKWTQIASETGIQMGQCGRNMVRRALSKIKRPYVALVSIGVKLSDAETALPIVATKFVRIDNAVKRADRTQREVSARHLTQLDSDKQKRMLLLASFFGAVRAAATSYKDQYYKKPSKKAKKQPVLDVLPEPEDKMAQARDLLERLTKAGVKLRLDANKIRASHQPGAYTISLREEVDELEAELAEILSEKKAG